MAVHDRSRQLSRWYRTQEVSAGARRRLGIPHLAIDDVSLARIEAEIDFEPIRQQVHAALEELPAGQAQAVSLRVGEELPYAEVARRLGPREPLVYVSAELWPPWLPIWTTRRTTDEKRPAHPVCYP